MKWAEDKIDVSEALKRMVHVRMEKFVRLQSENSSQEDNPHLWRALTWFLLSNTPSREKAELNLVIIQCYSPISSLDFVTTVNNALKQLLICLGINNLQVSGHLRRKHA